MSEAKVYLGNLSYDTGERDLEKFLKGYGRIRSISVKEGFGFAEFEDRRDAEDAVKVRIHALPGSHSSTLLPSSI